MLFVPTIGLRQVSVHWFLSRDGDQHARELYRRHYSCRRYADGRSPKLFCGPGEKMVLLTRTADALFVWRRFISLDGNQGLNCAVFRNEGTVLSSALILDAETAAWTRWPHQRMYTYVDPRSVKSTNPGCCFRYAGWRPCGITKDRSLLVLEKTTGGA